MSEPYIGEIRLFTYSSWVPYGWLLCNGQVYGMSQFMALASLIGNYYGGDGRTTFGVPNMCGQACMGTDGGNVGQVKGARNITLQTFNLPLHKHTIQRKVNASKFDGKTSGPTNNSTIGGYQTLVNGVPTNMKVFTSALTQSATTTLPDGTIGYTPSATTAQIPHENLQPYQCFWFGIAWDGIYPTFD